MRVWLESAARTPLLGASTTLSVCAHAILIAGAVYSTHVAASELAETIQNRSLRYLPPPDRIAGSAPRVEHLHYMELGGGAQITDAGRPDGRPKNDGGPKKEPLPGGNTGTETESQAPAPPVYSPDSIYSVLEVEEQVVRAEGSAAPAYPPDLMKAGTEGRAIARFVVDTTGRADLESVEIIRFTHQEFAESVRSAVPRMTFTPARVDGHKVRQAVEQTFDFKIVPAVPVAQKLKPEVQ
ncbi:MAG: energy transducer TonB [Gemmatimonadota bacterium]